MLGLMLLDLDPNSWRGRFFLQVIAVVVGGVLLLVVGAVLRWISIPFKWWWKNRVLHKLIRKRREFILVYNPQALYSKPIVLLDDGRIGEGRNDNENTWRVKRGCLEFVTDDGKLYNRFELDRAHGRLWGVADANVRALFGQYLFPQY